jgi:hypothetical protein
MRVFTFEDYVKRFDLEKLSYTDQKKMLGSIAHMVHVRFLEEIEKKVSKEDFDTILSSIKVGRTLYLTTLKHLAPGYEILFEEARDAVRKSL